MKKVLCDSCNQEVIAQSNNDHLPDRGILFYFQESGYYGGFTDNEPWETENRMEPWKMCHDCVVKFLNTFPHLAQKLGGGHHPVPEKDITPCCQHCWTFHMNKDGQLVTMYADGQDWKQAHFSNQ